MKNSTQCYAVLLATCCLLFAGSLYAAKTPKVDICHYDADQGIYKPISVSINAEQKHLDNHGDLYPNGAPGTASVVLDADCNVSETPPKVFAVAYINVDEEAGYGEKDIAIAELLDANNNSVLDAGDKVRLGEYPTSFDPCPSDEGLAPPERVCGSGVAAFVTADDDTSSPVLEVTSVASATYGFKVLSGTRAFLFSLYTDSNGGSQAEFSLHIDGTDGTDHIQIVDLGGYGSSQNSNEKISFNGNIGLPYYNYSNFNVIGNVMATEEPAVGSAAVDDYFIDVEIFQ